MGSAQESTDSRMSSRRSSLTISLGDIQLQTVATTMNKIPVAPSVKMVITVRFLFRLRLVRVSFRMSISS